MDGPARAPPQEPVTFEDVAVCFSPEEWKELVNWQKDLYKDVMRENFEMLSSLELTTHKPDIILMIEQGRAPCVQRPLCPKSSERPNHTFPDAQIQIKKESCLEEVRMGQQCRAVIPEAVKGNLDSGDACGFPPRLEGHYTTPVDRNGVVTLLPWPTELKWASGTMAGQEPTLVGFQVGNPGVSGGHFWPTNVAHEELLLICTQCQKCFPAPMAHCFPSEAPVGEGTQVCSECDTRNMKGLLPLYPMASPQCACAHCLATPNARPRPPKEERPYKCGKCDKSFRFAHEHTWHQKVHAGEKIYKCGQCEKIFRHRQELMWHQRTHTPEWPHKCPTCQKSFRFKQELAWHLKTHSVERPYTCPECGKSFRFKQEFAWHQRAHVGDRPYACPECEKTFRFKQEFTWHQRSHATEKSYKCPGCDKSFRYKQEFIWHQRIHTGEQPYPCASCNSTFTCRQEYMRHQRLHDGEKPYHCPHCEKTFRRGSTLIRHRRIHVGGGPFKCMHCERSFGQNVSLARHQRIHEMEDGTKGDLSGWPPCFQSPVQTETVSMLSLKAVSVGALLFLNLQEAKHEKGREGQPHAVWGEHQT